MLRKINILFPLAFLFITQISFSQNFSNGADTIKKESPRPDSVKVRKHSPRASMLMSVVVPGLGQAYNKKYWKIPLIYASMGTTLYFFRENNKIYKEYKQAYINKVDTLTSTVDEYKAYPASWLQQQGNTFRHYRDLNVILTALFYTINVVDAYVDAHLMNFDVSDDLSVQIMPSLNFTAANRKPSTGLTLCLTF